MIQLEHVAIWVEDLEKMTVFYEDFLNGKRNEKYFNPATRFTSYFVSFGAGARLELMHKEDIPANLNDPIRMQYRGIIHMAFQLKSRSEVDRMATFFREKGIEILRGPRTTGDGYYEFETVDPENNRIEITAL